MVSAGGSWEACERWDGAELVTGFGVKKLDIDFCVLLCEGVGFPIVGVWTLSHQISVLVD